tara:strand:- start:1447 stop:1710 length:264 start_codon:yes stop_codon:yes gene_type:complete
MNEFENYLTEYELSEWASSDPYGFAIAYARSHAQQPAPQNSEDTDWLTVDNLLDVLGILAGAGIFLGSKGRIRPNLPFGMNPPRQLP